MNDYYNYKDINSYNGTLNPSTVHITNSSLYHYFKFLLINKIYSVYKFTLPDDWNYNYFKSNLFINGFIGVTKLEEFGVICQHGTLNGYNIMYSPTEFIISNPLIKGYTKTLKIEEDCYIVKIQEDYGSVLGIVNYYSDLLTNLSISLDTNIINSKFSYIFACKNQSTAESFKNLFDRVQSGDLAIFADKNLFTDNNGKLELNIELFNQNVGQNFISDKLIDAYNAIMNQFNTLIGIPSPNTDKKERLISEEVKTGNIESECLATLWEENINKQFLKINNKYNLKLHCEYLYKQERGQNE